MRDSGIALPTLPYSLAALAEDAGYALRDHVTQPQSFFEAVSEQLPDVHFTIQQQYAFSVMAAMIREQRLEGLLEGLRLAGLFTSRSISCTWPGNRMSAP